MKKIFTLSLMAAAALSMSAAQTTRTAATSFQRPTANLEVSAPTVVAPGFHITGMHRVAPVSRAAEDVALENLLGVWTLEGYDIYGDYEEIEFEILEGEAEGAVILQGFLYADVEATYDAANAELSIPYQVIGYDEQYAENIYLGELIYDEVDKYFEATGETVVATFDGEALEFDEGVIIGTFGEDPNEGFYSFVLAPNVFKGLNWEVLGEADYLDFILQSNVFAFEEPLPEVKCELRRHKDQHSYYRLVEPWDYLGLEGVNLDFIYLLDGDMVVIPEINFGVYDLGLGQPCYVIMASASYLDGVLFGGEEVEDGEGGVTTLPTPEEWLADPENEGLNITCKDYVVRPDAGKEFNGKMVGSIITYLPNVGMYYGNALDGYIALPKDGIENVSIDNTANGPIEYYNLQGIRVYNPAAGQIYIRRQGTNATKVIM